MTEEQHFTKGFNNGYLLAKHEPVLLKQLLIAKNDNEYFKGMVLGKKQHEIEKMRVRLKTVSKSETTVKKQITKGFSEDLIHLNLSGGKCRYLICL
ncbi:hypothetical protein EMGBS15_05270 [Filimonas sp.]|nr:hypothetical protein EMGBS15_05270 [Filimonas sp.]